MARVRSFIGVGVGDEIRRKAVALQQQLARTGAGVKWAAEDGMHVTLLFLGELDDRDILPVCRAVQTAAAPNRRKRAIGAPRSAAARPSARTSAATRIVASSLGLPIPPARRASFTG